ncbi:acetylcholinesterase-1 [Parasteatoda tepidariorum]|uniref:acetylcholinesterase-1 n=1 Tax=Parasteatoda tepidariorum TaxID=114398 RepID=UPI001C724EB4|nr:acetylcholinesterase-1 [Parasteatoda tepidariorum]
MKRTCFKQFLINICSFGVLYFFGQYGVCFASACNKNPYIKETGPLVETSSGPIVGKYVKVFDTDVAAFLGIPFAKPPIGEKRFAKPEPIGKWETPIFANAKPSSCVQFSSRDFHWIPKGINISEDCLYLNVWTPVHCNCNDFNKLPVLVWIHGGGFYAGSSTMDVYDGSIFSSYGDAVIVSVNYRLGIFGFLNAGIDQAPGNVGLFDQLLALKWINANIQNFGGDPNSITLFGESAGSISINDLLLSPLSDGLFHKVIMESGTAYYQYYTDNSNIALFKASTFSKVVGCESENKTLATSPVEVVQCLKEKDSSQLAEAENMFTSKFPLFFTPTFGDEFLPQHPILQMKSGEFPQLPILIGNNKNEGSVFLSYAMPDVFPSDKSVNLTLLQAKNVIRGLFANAPEVSPEVVFAFYFRNITEDNSAEVVQAISNAFGDFTFNCPSLFLAEKTNNSRLYWLTHRSLKEGDAEWMGIPHFYEVQYIFGKPIIDALKYTPEDGKFSGDLIKKWVNFARTGNPISDNSNGYWPKLVALNPTAYELNPRSEGAIPHPRLEACEFWRPYIVYK